MSIDVDATAAGEGIFGLDFEPDRSKVILVPVPFEATVSYGGGSAQGPQAILEASRQLDLDDFDFRRAFEHGVHMLAPDPRIEAHNASAKAAAQTVIAFEAGEEIAREAVDAARTLVNAQSMEVHQWVYETVREKLAGGQIVGTIGGDHSCAYGAIRAHAEAFGELGILHIDAHADLRDAYQGFRFSHASIMHRVLEDLPEVVKLSQVAIRDYGPSERKRITGSQGRVETWFDPMLARARICGGLSSVFHEIVESLPKQVYVSFDIDGLDPKLCPNTGTPVPGGLDFNEAWILISEIAKSGRKIVGFDLMEVSPGDDEWDGNVGARILYKLIGWTLYSQGLRGPED